VTWLQNFRKKRAAKAYARKLPRLLKQSWGFSDHYTPAQIKTSAKKLGLDLRYVAFGYAGFLPPETYESLRSEMPIDMTFDEARELFEYYFPLNLWSAQWEPTGESSGGSDGFPSSSHH